MALSIQEALARCYDNTTPNGSGNSDPFTAAWNKLAYETSYAHIHSGMKALKEEHEVEEALLMILFTDQYTNKQVKTVTDFMFLCWCAENQGKEFKEETIRKVSLLMSMALATDKLRQTGKKVTIENVCSEVGISRSNWNRKGNNAQWKTWYNYQLSLLENIQSQAVYFMQPYLNKVEESLRRKFH